MKVKVKGMRERLTSPGGSRRAGRAQSPAVADHAKAGVGERVNHPAHYAGGGIEVIDAIEAWQLGFHLGNVVKYIARAAHKGAALEDARKARWYLDRYIQKSEAKS